MLEHDSIEGIVGEEDSLPVCVLLIDEVADPIVAIGPVPQVRVGRSLLPTRTWGTGPIATMGSATSSISRTQTGRESSSPTMPSIESCSSITVQVPHSLFAQVSPPIPATSHTLTTTVPCPTTLKAA